MKNKKMKFDGIGPVMVMIFCAGLTFSWAETYESIPVSQDVGGDGIYADSIELEDIHAELADGETKPEGQSMLTAAEAKRRADECRYERPEDFEHTAIWASGDDDFYLAEICPEDGGSSYAQILMDELILKDTAWFDEIYALAKAGPYDIGTAEVKQVSVLYKDGDGNAQTAVSNTEEILAMASVYAETHGTGEIDDIRTYVHELWKRSHTYEVEQSEIYFCTECMSETDESEPEENEATEIEPEGGRTDGSEASETAAAEETESSDREMVLTDSDALEESAECPGHMDLKITAEILTLNGSKSLFEADRIGSQAAEDGEWEGWTNEHRKMVEQLCGLSWYREYGLCSAEKEAGRPLTDVEIETYMGLLDEEIDEMRRLVIRFALESVGRVQYYWGGKPYQKGYGDGQFSAVVEPDSHGRSARGLDCSGWVSWVYWSVTQERLPYESTSGLCSLGTAVDVADLRAGDLAIRTGEDSHVVLYLGKTRDGRMLCVHESSYTGTVAVSEMSLDWGYYRNILNERSALRPGR